MLVDWAKYQQTKRVVNLHLLLDHEEYLPVIASMIGENVHEVNIANTVKFPKVSILPNDRGYADYEQFARWRGHRYLICNEREG
jgi:hypothetical protein